jgi:SulP family sulfate permease
MSSRLVPSLLGCIRKGYGKKDLFKDVSSGIIVGIVALPLTIAFAIASGVSPEQGLYTAIIAGFLVSFLGGTKFQIAGPTGAFIVVIVGIINDFGYSGLAVATILAGLMLIFMGVARLGTIIKFIPYPMTVGFTSGIALIIAVTQLKDLLGLNVAKDTVHFTDKIIYYTQALPTINPHAVAVGLFSILLLIVWPKVTKRVPGSIVAILITTAAVQFFDMPVRTIGSQFATISSHIPTPSIPMVDMETLPKLFAPALTIAILGGIESLLSAVVADGMKGTRHNSNMELIAQGVANVATPLFGGIPATGAIARTATNIQNGAVSPISGMVHAVTLLMILVFLGKWATLIPMATLAAILIMVAYHMSEWKHFLQLLRSPMHDILVMMSTFFLTVFIDLTVAIQTGVVLSAILFMNRMADTAEIKNIKSEMKGNYKEDEQDIDKDSIPRDVEVFEIHGPFFFGAANHFKDTISIVKKPPKALVLRMRHINTIDATAIRALQDVIDKTRKQGTRLIFSGVNPTLKALFDKYGITEHVGEKNIFDNIFLALVSARDD